MSLNIARPNLNRGLSAEGGRQGTHQPSMGNMRGSDFKFPQSLSKSQVNGNPETNARKTYSYAINPPPNGEDANFDTGSLYFMQKTDKNKKDIFDLSMVRAFSYQSHNNKFCDRVSNSNNAEEDNSTPSHLKKSGKRDMSFFSDFNLISLELELCGVGIGKDDPSEIIGDQSFSYSNDYSGELKLVPFVWHGYATCPNFWRSDLLQGQDLYIMIKPVVADTTYINTEGTIMNMTPDMRPYDVVPDVLFYTSPSNTPPNDEGCVAELNRCRGEQPALMSRSWIDWSFDIRAKPTNGVVPMYGEKKDAMVWRFGIAQQEETLKGGQRQQTSRGTNTSRLPMMVDYNRMADTMEVLIDIKRHFLGQ